jgi:hypothetical protein
MENREAVIEKIRKIMSLAENNPSENEAISAALMAQKLMAKYNINEMEIRQEVTENNIDSLRVVVNGKVQKWRVSLALVVAKNFRCRIYLMGHDIVFYGYKRDADICKEVFLSLYRIGVKLSDKAKRESRSKCGTAKGVRNSFCTGFVSGIRSELEKQSTALIIVVPKEVNEKYDDMAKGWKKRSSNVSTKDFNYDAYKAGVQAGKDAMQSKRLASK